jgi:hypothetical protein
VEHSGLGRFGYALNPWGDIIVIAKAWCVTKVNGSLTLAVMFNENKEYIRYNADRFHGKIRCFLWFFLCLFLSSSSVVY